MANVLLPSWMCAGPRELAREIHRSVHLLDVRDVQRARRRTDWERGGIFLGDRRFGVRKQSREVVEENLSERRRGGNERRVGLDVEPGRYLPARVRPLLRFLRTGDAKERVFWYISRRQVVAVPKVFQRVERWFSSIL